MKVYLEHANMRVRSIDATVRFFTTAFPEFKVRHDYRSPDGHRWAHLGTDESYLTLNETPDAPNTGFPHQGVGVNHLGFVVEDAEAIQGRLIEAGYREGYLAPPHPHRKRLYIFDEDGIEWEFVEYLSSDPAERNDYELGQSG